MVLKQKVEILCTSLLYRAPVFLLFVSFISALCSFRSSIIFQLNVFDPFLHREWSARPLSPADCEQRRKGMMKGIRRERWRIKRDAGGKRAVRQRRFLMSRVMHREISDRENVGIKACRMIVVPHLCSRERSSTYISRTSQASSHTHRHSQLDYTQHSSVSR